MIATGYSSGLDVGGTKIEARLFASDWSVLATREVATPLQSYESFLDALSDQIAWLQAKAQGQAVPTGIGLPGVVDQRSGTILTANLPASGKPLWRDIASRFIGIEPVILNDSCAFALSEAVLGAGRGHETVLATIIGTGLSGGLVHQGHLMEGANRAAGEFGHMPISAPVQRLYDLPVLPCGCGRLGCYETLCSGVGLSRLAKHVLGHEMDGKSIGARAAEGSDDAKRVIEIWVDLLSDLFVSLCLTVDPGCIVLGGGASQMPGICERVKGALCAKVLSGMQVPAIRLAEGGPRSGARGAALAARRAHDGSS